MSDHRWTDLAPAYALGALEGEELRAFEERLEDDADLRALVDEYRAATAAALAGQLPARTPRPDLRERVLRRARSERPPAVPEESGARAGGGSPPIGNVKRGAGALPWALLAASLAALTWVGVRNGALQGEVDTLSEQLAEVRTSLRGAETELARVDSLAEVLAGPNVRFATLSGETAPALRLVWNPDRRALLLAASELPAPAEGRTYQLWGIRGTDAPVSLGTFATGPDGRALVTLTPGVEPDFDLSAVTDEPAGGSPQPTTQPFLVGSWRAAQD